MSGGALLTLVLLCPQPLQLDEALRRAAAGAPLPPGTVSTQVAQRAAGLALNATASQRARPLLTVAGAGGLPLPLLCHLPLGAEPPAWADIARDPSLDLPAARVAVVLLARRLPVRDLEALLADERLPLGRRSWLATLAALVTPQPVALFRALATSHDPAWDQALMALVQREQEVGAAALTLARTQPAPGLVRALGGLGPSHREPARTLLLTLLSDDDPELVAAAVAAAAALHLSELADRLPRLAQAPTPVPVRRAALAAVPALLYREPATFALLIDQLQDPLVSDVAYDSLKTKSGVRLPPVPQAWRSWLNGKGFPAEPSSARAARLETAWRLLLRLRDPRQEPPPPAQRAPLDRPTAAPPTAQAPLDRLGELHRSERRRMKEVGGAILNRPRSKLPQLVAWALLALVLGTILIRRWVMATTRSATRRVEPRPEPEPPPAEDLSLAPTRRIDRLRQALVRRRTGPRPPSAALASSAEAEVIIRFRRALERLREQERVPEREPVAHLSFSAKAQQLEQTLPVTEIFLNPTRETPAEERTTPLADVFPSQTPAEERTTPLADVFPSQTPAEERTTPLADVFPSADASEERTTPLADVFPSQTPAEERTTPLADVFPSQTPAEERTTPLADVFPSQTPAEERTTPLADVFPSADASEPRSAP